MAGKDDVIGKVSPDFILGFNTNLRLWKFNISAVFDWKQGGQIYCGTNGLLDMYGVSKNTENREGSFLVEGVKEDGSKTRHLYPERTRCNIIMRLSIISMNLPYIIARLLN